MNHEDLLKMLRIAPPSSTVQDVVEEVSVEPEFDGELADTVLYQDAWVEEQGRRLAPLGRPEENEALADFFAAAFHQQPELTGPTVVPLRQQFIEALLESPDFNVLRQSTAGNLLASQMAAVKLGTEFQALLAKNGEKKAELGPILGAVGRAVGEAQEEVDELGNLSSALGMGGAAEGDRADLAAVNKLFQRVRNSRTLKRICELAGRYRRVAQSKQRAKVQHGYDDMVGVELSGDVGRLLPLELAMLADEDFELDAMRRLVERQSMCREFRGVEPKGKGPIVICVDESGSMDGEPVCNAKAFALAMAWVARHQNRWCCLVGYSGGTQGTMLALPPKKWDETKLVEWLEHFYGAGTDMDIPLVELPKMMDKLGAPKGKTDLILITDAICRVPAQMEQTFNAWKAKEKVRCISLIIGHSAGGLSKVSDEVHLVRSIGLDETGIQQCLSV